ncbi:glutathione S-transferase [Pestalotiopsis sp. NC0098]|nr:glutathione S-transferase [Pestalotiopsis sp. NC0098]
MAENKLTLLHLQHSQSQTILWLLEELKGEYNFEYELKVFERVKQRAPEALKETHPLGKSPQLITETGRVITERDAIALYLIERFDTAGKFKIASGPASTDDDAVKENMIISFGNSSLGLNLILRFIFKALVANTPFFLRPLPYGISALLNKAFLNAEIDATFSYFNSLLEGREYLLGGQGPTRADFVLLWYIDWAKQSELYDAPSPKFKNIQEWLSRCTSRPAWKSGLEKGNGYNLVDFK